MDNLKLIQDSLKGKIYTSSGLRNENAAFLYFQNCQVHQFFKHPNFVIGLSEYFYQLFNHKEAILDLDIEPDFAVKAKPLLKSKFVSLALTDQADARWINWINGLSKYNFGPFLGLQDLNTLAVQNWIAQNPDLLQKVRSLTSNEDLNAWYSQWGFIPSLLNDTSDNPNERLTNLLLVIQKWDPKDESQFKLLGLDALVSKSPKNATLKFWDDLANSTDLFTSNMKDRLLIPVAIFVLSIDIYDLEEEVIRNKYIVPSRISASEIKNSLSFDQLINLTFNIQKHQPDCINYEFLTTMLGLKAYSKSSKYSDSIEAKIDSLLRSCLPLISTVDQFNSIVEKFSAISRTKGALRQRGIELFWAVVEKSDSNAFTVETQSFMKPSLLIEWKKIQESTFALNFIQKVQFVGFSSFFDGEFFIDALDYWKRGEVFESLFEVLTFDQIKVGVSHLKISSNFDSNIAFLDRVYATFADKHQELNEVLMKRCLEFRNINYLITYSTLWTEEVLAEQKKILKFAFLSDPSDKDEALDPFISKVYFSEEADFVMSGLVLDQIDQLAVSHNIIVRMNLSFVDWRSFLSVFLRIPTISDSRLLAVMTKILVINDYLCHSDYPQLVTYFDKFPLQEIRNLLAPMLWHIVKNTPLDASQNSVILGANNVVLNQMILSQVTFQDANEALIIFTNLKQLDGISNIILEEDQMQIIFLSLSQPLLKLASPMIKNFTGLANTAINETYRGTFEAYFLVTSCLSGIWNIENGVNFFNNCNLSLVDYLEWQKKANLKRNPTIDIAFLIHFCSKDFCYRFAHQ